jgi:hypothetical protein
MNRRSVHLAVVGTALILGATALRAQPTSSAPTTRPAVASSLVSAAGTNLLLNSSFEDRSGTAKDGEPWGQGYLDGVARSPFAHWGYSGFWDGGDYDIKLGQGHTGKLCARLVCREKGRGGIASEAVHAAAGSVLQFKGWFKAVGASGGVSRVNFEGEPGDGFASISLPAKPDYEWTEVTARITVPIPKEKKAGDPVAVLVFIYIQTYGELWIDDVTLAPLG